MTTLPKARIGILGAGQLALMLAESAEPLGITIVCAGQPGDCAEQLAPVLSVDLRSTAAVSAFAERADVLTIESENIDANVLHGLHLFPNEQAIGIAQDRLAEKDFLGSCGIRVAPFAPVTCPEDFVSALKATGLPAILKTRRMGYDGKGQVRLQRAEEVPAAWAEVEAVPCIMEGMLQFDTEVSLVAARAATGEIVFYPLVENFHRDGILRTSIAPYARPELQPLAETYMRRVMEKLEYIGVLAIEFFVQGDALIANEMAPRVHNSGHWTIEGTQTSQFENHLRAITGMPLGSTASKPTVMLNCIGSMPSIEETDAFPEVIRHDYGKAPRPGRKVGHLTLPASYQATITEWQRRLELNG